MCFIISSFLNLYIVTINWVNIHRFYSDRHVGKLSESCADMFSTLFCCHSVDSINTVPRQMTLMVHEEKLGHCTKRIHIHWFELTYTASRIM